MPIAMFIIYIYQPATDLVESKEAKQKIRILNGCFYKFKKVFHFDISLSMAEYIK